MTRLKFNTVAKIWQHWNSWANETHQLNPVGSRQKTKTIRHHALKKIVFRISTYHQSPGNRLHKTAQSGVALSEREQNTMTLQGWTKAQRAQSQSQGIITRIVIFRTDLLYLPQTVKSNYQRTHQLIWTVNTWKDLFEPACEIMVLTQEALDLSHRRPAPEPSQFAHMKYGSRRRVWQNIRHLAPLDGCACAFEEWVYRGQKSTIISWDCSYMYLVVFTWWETNRNIVISSEPFQGIYSLIMVI